jgi:hypothetical protein
MLISLYVSLNGVTEEGILKKRNASLQSDVFLSYRVIEVEVK